MLNDVKRDKIKKHFQNNKKKYVVVGAVVGVGALTAGAYILGTKVAAPENVISPEAKQILNWKPTLTQNVEVYIEALGDPGNIIQDTTTGTIYASQGQAAKALGVTAGAMSKHINGQLADIDGHILTKLGKAGANLAVPTIAE